MKSKSIATAKQLSRPAAGGTRNSTHRQEADFSRLLRSITITLFLIVLGIVSVSDGNLAPFTPDTESSLAKH
jgi:hypothetical protein